MKTATVERILLFSDEIAERKHATEILKQKELIEQAVGAFNSLGLDPLQPDELSYFLQGGDVWPLIRWKDFQQVPKGFPANVNKEKYLEILERPNFTQISEATRKCSILMPGMFSLVGEKVMIDEEISQRFIFQDRIYAEGEQAEKLQKLQTLKNLLEEFHLLHPKQGSTDFQLIDIGVIGLRVHPHVHDEGRFYFDAHRLKDFLAK